MQNLLLYLTTYSIALAVLSKIVALPSFVVEYIHSLVFVVFAAVVYVYARYGALALRSFYGNLINWHPDSIWGLLLIDLCFHVLVLVWVGLPTNAWALSAAYATFIVWYGIVRDRIQEIYIKEIPLKDYDLLAFIVLPLFMTLYAFLKK